MLQVHLGIPGRRRAIGCAGYGSGAGSDGSALAAANRRAKPGAEHSADTGGQQCLVVGLLRTARRLLISVLLADRLILLEHIERFAGGWHHQQYAEAEADGILLVMPAPGKPFDVFQQDQAVCKQYADQQTAGGAQQANNQALLTAGIGTVLGAGLGAAIGGGRGAAIGAGAGAITGTAYGAAPAGYAQMNLQQRYDASYSQCMYAHGDQVPGYYPPRRRRATHRRPGLRTAAAGLCTAAAGIPAAPAAAVSRPQHLSHNAVQTLLRPTGRRPLAHRGSQPAPGRVTRGSRCVRSEAEGDRGPVTNHPARPCLARPTATTCPAATSRSRARHSYSQTTRRPGSEKAVPVG